MQGEIHILAKLVVVIFTLPGICLHPHPSFMVDFPASHISFLEDMYLWCQNKKTLDLPRKKNCGKLLQIGLRSAKNQKSLTQRLLRFPPRTTKAWNKRLGPTPVRAFVGLRLRLDRFVTFASKKSAISEQFLMLPHYFGVIFC